jgi:ribosome-binding protein aMBF1 (putative translation factor)
MMTHEELKALALSDPKVKAEYDALEDEFALLNQMLSARNAAGLSQSEVAARMGTKQSAIARIEGAYKHSPSLNTLRNYAKAVGCHLELRLVPLKNI